MLDYFFCYKIYDNSCKLFKIDSRTSGYTKIICTGESNLSELREIAKEEGSLLLGPFLCNNKNRLRLIKYYEKDKNQNRVKVYRNLRRGDYSFMQNNLVVGYNNFNTIYLENCTPIIREGGRNRAIKTGVRNVHAFIEGDITYDKNVEYHRIPIRYHLERGFLHHGKPIDFKNKIIKISETSIYISM